MKQILIILTCFVLSLLTQNAFCQQIPAFSPNLTNPKTPSIEDTFYSSGWMGDGEDNPESIQLSEGYRDDPKFPVCTKVFYAPPSNGKGWAGIYWQNQPDNWGDEKGENFSKKGYKRITFWARGETGEEIVEFKAGGINKKKYKDSFEVSTGKVYLEKDWKQYSIDLKGKELSSVIGGFCWVATRSANPDGLKFYLHEIRYE